MYAYIKGKIVDKTFSNIIVDCGNIGYDISVSGNTLADFDLGEIVTVYTYLYVREDAMCLYGFSRKEEKSLFMKLIEISGVGPKLAMQVLSGYDLKTLTVAIASGDVKTLCKIKGLGKKTAELIILNLRDTATEDMLIGGESAVASPIVGDDISQAVMVLESLGVSKTDGVRLASEAAKSVSGVENIIAYCLKMLG